MSYDIEICVKVDGTENTYACVARPKYPSPTYNLGKMFRVCTGWDYTQGEWYKCSEVIDNINHGIQELSCNAKAYKQYEPDNGWGTISGAKQVLESLRDCIYEQAENIPINCLYVRW